MCQEVIWDQKKEQGADGLLLRVPAPRSMALIDTAKISFLSPTCATHNLKARLKIKLNFNRDRPLGRLSGSAVDIKFMQRRNRHNTSGNCCWQEACFIKDESNDSCTNPDSAKYSCDPGEVTSFPGAFIYFAVRRSHGCPPCFSHGVKRGHKWASMWSLALPFLFELCILTQLWNISYLLGDFRSFQIASENCFFG